ncbi:ATP-dependent DNA helicase 2 subunit KU80 isoform X1 [Carex littledalei]|uniref:ATP-dependent DNA helicase 2 subunit KU80 n=1 Tax=Carex littledalei TaxID=544730 RepID=A0A833RCH3_9POAL|nr:ATP-dependent DNA helicase 2 subunit KU80 isoform X1 [Carex littledalei]
MARNKEALVLLIDVGPSMHGVLPEIEKVCSLLMQKKLIFGKYDEVGIVLFGTDETENELAIEVGGYEHVSVLRNIKVVDGDAIEIIQNLKRGTSRGDFIDAIVVGIDMLIKKYGATNKGKHRICIITDARFPIKVPYEGTKEEQVDAISEQMKEHGIKLESIIFRESQVVQDEVTEENDRLLGQFAKRTTTRVVHVDSPTSLLGALKTRNVAPVTVYRGDLEISPNCKIKVWVYKKTSEEKFPTLKKFSDKAPPTDKFATHEVKVEFQYKSMVEPDKYVPPEQRIKGYRYGPQVVPMASHDWDSIRFRPEKGVKLLGFTDVSNVLRHYYMKDVYMFIPEPKNNRAIVAVSAIARAMKEMNKCAILRCVWRRGQGNVVIGVLTPNISSVDNIPDSFYFNVLPFAEDLREFQFPSFDRLPAAWQPTTEQQEAADNFVLGLDLTPPGREEILPPDFTPNPVLERFYRFLDLKSKQPDADVQPLDPALKRITEPDPDLLSLQLPLLEKLSKSFELRENPKKKRTSKIAWRPRNPTNQEIEAGPAGSQNATTSSNNLKIEGPSASGASLTDVEIGDLNPVEDFEAMMARRDSSKWVQVAIEQMKRYINDLLENSVEGDGSYVKAIDCLKALRKSCIIEQEPNEFNKFLKDMYEKWRATSLASFFGLLCSKGITLISKEEAADSDVTEETAKSFLCQN